MMESNYKYRGDLRSTTLPEMLHTIHRTRVPGVIEARRGADRPDDEAIIALGALLRERKPQLADIRSAA